jgi:hypothetical protein
MSEQPEQARADESATVERFDDDGNPIQDEKEDT